MIQLDAPQLLFLLPAAVLATFAGALWARRRRIQYAAAWSRGLGLNARRHGRWTPLALALVAGAGIVGLAGPRWGSERVTAETQALNLVIAVDISRSMLAPDAIPTRLGRALREARRLVDDLRGDQLGLIAFAGGSHVLSPLTIDGSALRLFLDALDPGAASEGGTALAPVLRQGAQVLSGSATFADRVLVVFTDGEGHDSLSSILEEARRLADIGIKLILVAQGETRPVRIPLIDIDGKVVDFIRDAAGRPVETRRRDDILEVVAQAGHGTLVPAGLADQAGAVRDRVESFKRVATARTSTTRGVLRAWIPISIGVVLLFLAGWGRRTGALIALAIGLTLPGKVQAQALGRDRADAAWRAGEVQRAADLYAAKVRKGIGGDTLWLNAGTAAAAAGNYELALTGLRHASASHDPEVRFRALFNLGWLSLLAAKTDSARALEHLATAERAYREALLLRPDAQDAKWNLELAISRRRASAAGSENQRRGGNGGADPDQAPSPGTLDQSLPQPTPMRFSRAQAEQILASIAREELLTRMSKMGGVRRAMLAGGKNW